jgi:hypothetical protein
VARGFSRVYVHDRTLVLVLDLTTVANAVEEGGGAVLPPSWNAPALGEGST